MNWDKIRSRVLSSAECNDILSHIHESEDDDFVDDFIGYEPVQKHYKKKQKVLDDEQQQ